jgi:hypothetical protein
MEMAELNFNTTGVRFLDPSRCHDRSHIEDPKLMEDYVASCFKEYEKNPYILLPYRLGYAETLS